MKERLAIFFKQLSIKILFALVSFLVALYVFTAITDEIFVDKEQAFDEAVFHFLADNLSPGLLEVTKFFTFFGKPHFLIPAYLLLIIYFFLRNKKNYAYEVLIMGASSTLLLFGLKKVFQRRRPHMPIFEHLPGYSFPSGHALLSFVFCSVLIYLIWSNRLAAVWKWTAAILLVVFSLIIGISRIILRVHYASDVLAGFCLGYVWVIFALWVQRRYLNRRKLQELHILKKETSNR